MAAAVLATEADGATSVTARKRAASRAVKTVAHYLGNTPAVCRRSYIDPRVFDRFEGGKTIAPTLERLGSADLSNPRARNAIERAVVDLLSG